MRPYGRQYRRGIGLAVPQAAHSKLPVFKAHRLLHYSTLGLRVIKKHKKKLPEANHKVASLHFVKQLAVHAPVVINSQQQILLAL